MSLGSTATRSVPVADTAGLARRDVTGEPIAHVIAPRRRRGLAAAMALAVSVAMTPDVSGAATQQELEARVDSLAEQLKAVQECLEKINALLPLIHLQLMKNPAEYMLKHSN